MKGLLLKDLYLMNRHCRSYLLILGVFLGVSLVNHDSLFFAIYPCLMAGMIPITLVSYDEAAHWERYSAVLPYTRAQVVTSKYLLGLAVELAVALISLIAAGFRLNAEGALSPERLLAEGSLLLCAGLLAPCVSLPVLFKVGAVRGRLINYLVIGIICGGSVLIAGLFNRGSNVQLHYAGILPYLPLFSAALYAASWRLAVAFYQKREL